MRVITQSGHIYEGNMQSGEMSGFGRLINNIGMTFIGWWKNNKRDGNCYGIKRSGEIWDAYTGWLENSSKKGDFKKDHNIKMFFTSKLVLQNETFWILSITIKIQNQHTNYKI